MLRCLLFLLVLPGLELRAETYRFGNGQWNSTDWITVKSARFPRAGSWEQADDHIYNRVPGDATEDEMLSKRAAETHASLVRKQSHQGDLKLTATMSFDHRMAPAVLLAPELRDVELGTEYRSHIQIVLFDQGVNVWQGEWSGTKFKWTKVGYARFTLAKKRKYELKITKTAKTIEVSVDDGPAFGFASTFLGEQINVGLIGCEGINRFYKLQID